MNKKKIALSALIIVVLALHLFALNRGDTVNDEVFMAFRAVGLVDFDLAEFQTTPYEWFDGAIPWWTKLSFHDHPKLVPVIQKIFMALFGETNFGFRLPSALFGLASVWLLYLIGSRLYGRRAGALAAILYAVTLNHVYVSRVGLQEACVIFFLLFGSHLLLKSLERPKYLYALGAVIGLGLLVKYTFAIFIPIGLAYFALEKREYFRKKEFYGGLIIAMLVASPIIIYNFMLYRTVGHFDFQLSYIFGQNPEVWTAAPGKDIGTVGERLARLVPGLVKSYSWLFLSLAALALLGFLSAAAKKPGENFRRHRLLVLSLAFLFVLITLIGPGYRFLTMFAPYLALASAVFLDRLFEKKRLMTPVFAAFIAFEIFYSWNNQIAFYPLGPIPWTASYIRLDTYNWGYNELGDYLARELEGKRPALSFDMKYGFLEKIRDEAIDRQERQNLEPLPALIVYAGNFDDAAKLWILDRLHIYHAWPIISEKTYRELRTAEGPAYFKNIGFTDVYFIESANYVSGPELQDLKRGTPVTIENPAGAAAFQVFHFEL